VPHVVNGFGTWYWGKRRVFTRPDNCEWCGAYGELASYDTGKYLVAAFVPVFPLGTKRILDQCPRCRRHRVTSLKKWELTKATEVDARIEALARTPKDRDAALHAIRSAAAFQDAAAVRDIGEVIRRHHAHDPDLLAALGEATDLFGSAEEAERLLREAFRLKPDASRRRSLAHHLLTNGQAVEGAGLVRVLLEQHVEDAVPFGYLATNALQDAGEHAGALELLEDIARAAPEEGSKPSFARLKKTSEKDRGRGRKARRPQVTRQPRRNAGDSRWRWWLPAAIPPLVIVTAAVGYAWAAISAGEHRLVYVVNGLNSDYDVQVGDRTVHLPARGLQRVRIEEGVVPVKVLTTSLGIPDQTVAVQTPLWSRPFLDRTFVINPDQVALVVWESVPYSEHPTSAASQLTLHLDQTLHEFRGIDYEFQPFPPTIDLPSGGAVEYRTAVSASPDLDAASLFGWVGPEIGYDKLLTHARRVVSIDPENSDCFVVVRALTPPEELLDFLKPLLARRPAAVEAHRAYQQTVQLTAPDVDLAAEYRAYHQQFPDDAGFTYLLARVITAADEAEALYKEALATKLPAPRAAAALAFAYLGEGRFAEAMDMVEQAQQAMPYASDVTILREQILLANGRYLDLLQQSQYMQPEEETPAWALAEKACLHERLNDAHEANRIIQTARALAEPAEADELDRVGVAELAYMRGDTAEYVRLMSRFDDPDAKMRVALTRGQIDEAMSLLSDSAFENDTVTELLVAIAAASRGDEAAAGQARGLAAAALEDGDADERRAAGWLTGRTTPRGDEALRIALDVPRKSALLVTLGQMDAQRRDECFALARRLSFDTRYPHLLFQGATGGAEGRAGASSGP
jgi:tetratricopeptide (TPR) repeat protein